MAEHVLAFTQHAQHFHRRQKSQNAIHCVSQLHAFAEEKSAAPPLEQDIFGRNLEKFSTHAVEKHGGAKINCHLLDSRELRLGMCFVETLKERGPFVFGLMATFVCRTEPDEDEE